MSYNSVCQAGRGFTANMFEGRKLRFSDGLVEGHLTLPFLLPACE